MTAKNDITGDSIKSRNSNKAYRDNWDKIFGKKNKKVAKKKTVKNNWAISLIVGLYKYIKLTNRGYYERRIFVDWKRN